MDKICLILLGYFSVLVKGFEQPSKVLTLDQRINIFGTNCSEDLPPIQFVTIQRLPVPEGRGSEKRPATLLQYKLTLAGEEIILTLKHNQDLLTPGCVVHKHQHNGYKILYPCGKGIGQCLFTGKSEKHPGSWAAVNTCYGLKGIISFRNTSLVIAPLNRKAQDFSDKSLHQGEVHVVYRYVGKKIDFRTTVPPRTRRSERSNYRTKRSANIVRYIEASVVIDPSLNDLYKARAEEYTQTMFNVASKLYEHKSLGTNIKLCLSEIHIYESYDKIPVAFTTNAEQILKDFCKWHSDTSTTTPDCTVIFTRQDIKYRGQSSFVGLAPEGGMCNKGSNCAVVQDDGPTSGETIAHEIGHLLGMKHDNLFAECNSSSTAGVMVVGATGSAAFRWSTCSARALKRFLSKKDPPICLSNKPEGKAYSIGYNSSLPKPGTIYTKNQQCKMIHGENASYCSEHYQPPDRICTNLLCRHHDHGDCYYLSQVLDGSDCNNTRTWCMSAKCVAMDASDSVAPQDGAWTDWGSYSPCSRSCGGGVKSKRRSCTNPIPRYGGRNCEGPSIQAKICNLQACIGNSKREQCLGMVNNNKDWFLVPSEQFKGDQSCSIHCTNGTNMITYRQHYEDGRECNLKDEDVNDSQYARCLDGKCRSFGCDAVMDSNMTDDKCGVCNGTGDNCQRTFGNYEKSGAIKEFRNVVEIPKNRYSIVVNQSSIYSHISVVVNGKREINPDPHNQSLSDTYLIDGMRLNYSRSPDRLKIDGPTTSNIIIQVYQNYQDVPPILQYEYYSREQDQTSLYHWSVGWSDCSKSCGTGIRRPTVKCMNFSSDAVEDFLCDVKTKPSETWKSCNDYLCPPEWKTSNLSPCSVTCGDGGIRTQTVQCVRENNGTYLILDPPSGCDMNTKPSSYINCSYRSCPGVWRTGPWSECTEKCGRGKQTRNVTCTGADGGLVEEKLCPRETTPIIQQYCVKRYCPNMPYGPDCRNAIPNCKDYGPDACFGVYRPWAMKNCRKECEICSPKDNIRCGYLASIGINVCKTYPTWAYQNCRYMCEVCVDVDNCQSFLDLGFDICGPDHVHFARDKCPNICGYCGECRDLSRDCDKIDKSFCRTSLSTQANCRKYCGLCRH